VPGIADEAPQLSGQLIGSGISPTLENVNLRRAWRLGRALIKKG
jgi:hypothetical protein